MLFGYARVSTQSQNLDRQLDALCDYGVPADRLFVEKISGTTKDHYIYHAFYAICFLVRFMYSEWTGSGFSSSRI